MTPDRRWLTYFQYAAGLADTSTGLLLVFAPAWTLHLMHVNVLPEPIEFARYIGVFVFSVGLTYLAVALRWPFSAGNAEVWRTQWSMTALIRSLVALFLFVQVSVGRMELAWVTVALSDGALAAIQWIGLTRGWLEYER